MPRHWRPERKTITVTQIRSTIGNKPKTRGTLRALGLRKIGETNTLPDRPEIRGMIARVRHLITVDGELTCVSTNSPRPRGPTKAKRRVGRGIGGKGGKTAGRGTKGQQSRGAARSLAASKAARCRSSSASRS